MAYRLIWSPSARFDLNEISAYIDEVDPVAAAKFIRSVFNTVERLSRFPESGRIVPDFGDSSIREVIRRPCRIVYRVRHPSEVTEQCSKTSASLRLCVKTSKS